MIALNLLILAIHKRNRYVDIQIRFEAYIDLFYLYILYTVFKILRAKIAILFYGICIFLDSLMTKYSVTTRPRQFVNMFKLF